MMTVSIGTIVAYGGSFEGNTGDRLKRYLQNDGWLVCDGATVEKDYFFELYEVIGDNFGKANSYAMFKLPDLRNSSPGTPLGKCSWIIKAKEESNQKNWF